MSENYNIIADRVLKSFPQFEMYDFGGAQIVAPTPDLKEGGYVLSSNMAGIVKFNHDPNVSTGISFGAGRSLFFNFDPTKSGDFEEGLKRVITRFDVDSRSFPPRGKEWMIPTSAYCGDCGSKNILVANSRPDEVKS